mmetsp:Transcript_16729/g.36213  ORF Transcript_16729/g.36213 Transcript_16729/m.36213 type:complete len:613 (+) Transcript_16729:145-1983(+)
MPSLIKSTSVDDLENRHPPSVLVPDEDERPAENSTATTTTATTTATATTSVDPPDRNNMTGPCSNPSEATNKAKIESFLQNRCDLSSAKKKPAHFSAAASNEGPRPPVVHPPLARPYQIVQGSLVIKKGGNLIHSAVLRLLFEHAKAFYSWNAFRQYIADVASVTTIPSEWIEEAHGAFHERVRSQRRKLEKISKISAAQSGNNSDRRESDSKSPKQSSGKRKRAVEQTESQSKKARDVLYVEEKKKKARDAEHKEEQKKKAREAKLEEEQKKKKARAAKLEEEQKRKVKQWDSMYERLATHKNQTGTLDVKKDDDEELFDWIKKQKSILVLYFQNKPIPVSMDQARKLTSLGFSQSRPGIVRASGIIDSSFVENQWNQMLGELKAFKERFGSMTFNHVSNSHPDYQQQKTLKYWVADQRREYRQLRLGISSNMTAERIQKLNAIGLDMEPRALVQGHSWEERIEQLTSFVEEHGHCKIPLRHPQLGNFSSTIRQRYKEREEGKKNSLSDERMSQLVDLGFVFEAGKSPNFRSRKKMSWGERYEELLEFKEEHGHVIVPQNSGPLGTWVKEQRTGYRKMKAGEKSPMTTEKALKLSEIGFVFDASDRWNKGN